MVTARVLGHRQTKEAATDNLHLRSPRHISTLSIATSTTTDDRDFVIVTFGANAGGPGGNIVFGPTGDAVGDGGGAQFTLPTREGISTKDVPTDLGSLPADLRLSVTLRSEAATP
jgi:hypothetical protein